MERVFGRGSWVANSVLFGIYHVHQPWSITANVITRKDWRLIVKKVLRWMDVFAYLVLAALAIQSGARVTLWYVGLGLSALFAVLWLVAKWQLGDAFSVRPEARLLVTRGVYSKIRHRIYVFGTLAFLCAVFALLGWSVLVIWLVVIPIQVSRARREERVLADAFGPEYVAYRSRTWF